MRIDEFKAKAPQGFSRTNRYAVYFDNPKVMVSTAHLPMILMFCEKVDLPGINLNTTPIRDYGEIRETPYEVNYDPITLSFYVDTNMIVKGYFDAWIKGVQNPTNRNFNYYKDYTCSKMTIEVQDINDQTKYKAELFDVYPKTVSPITLSYENRGIMKMQVTMVYRYWKASPMNSEAATSIGAINPALGKNAVAKILGKTSSPGDIPFEGVNQGVVGPNSILGMNYRDVFSDFEVDRFGKEPFTDWYSTQLKFNNFSSETATSITGVTGLTGIAPNVETFRVF